MCFLFEKQSPEISLRLRIRYTYTTQFLFLKSVHSCVQTCIKRKYFRRKQENNPVIRSEYIIAPLTPNIAYTQHGSLSLFMQITGIQQISPESTNQQNAYRFDHTADSYLITCESFNGKRQSVEDFLKSFRNCAKVFGFHEPIHTYCFSIHRVFLSRLMVVVSLASN